MNRILTIVDKEWAEVFKNRIVLFTVGFLPLIFTAMPLGILYATRSSALGGDVSDVPPQFLAACGNIAPGQCLQVFLINQFMLLFMMMPLIIPVAIAAYSIVGEKTTRSLEPLLATPITTVELLAGKSLAAAIAATWAGFIVFLIGAPIVGVQAPVFVAILSPVWLLAIFGVGPLMAILAVNFAIVVSSRVTDPRVAEQISAVIIVPLMGLVFGQIAGVIIVTLQLMIVVAGLLALADVGMVYVGARLFQRETILTKWK